MSTGVEKRNPVLICLGITAAYWALILIGPGLVILFNNIALWFSGGGFYEDSFGYKVLVFFSQSIACGLACSAAESISDGTHQVCVLVNEIVSICILLLLALGMFFILGKILNGVNYVSAAIVTIVCTINTTRSLTKS